VAEDPAKILPSDTDGRALVAWNLRLLRTTLGYSQDQLAAEAGIDRAYVGGLERREGNPTVEMLERLAKALSIPLARFFIVPKKGSMAPRPMRCGRKSKNKRLESSGVGPSAAK
jgi:transcriptional regulator with XRE-family HTH domain